MPILKPHTQAKTARNAFYLAAWVLLLAGLACRLPLQAGGLPQEAPGSPIETAATNTATARPTRTPSPTWTPTRMATSSATPSATPTGTPTFTPIPTYITLRAQVLVRSNCRYGPGAPYLYKYGLVPGSNLEVIGRNARSTWILVQAIGGNNPCWVKADLMEVRGDLSQVAPTYLPLPPSPYYGPPRGVSAVRQGDMVTVFWSPVSLRAGDETAEAPILVEAWLCQDGELVFTPLGSYARAVELRDEPGCSEPSHGRVMIAEKHGYSLSTEIPWPEH